MVSGGKKGDVKRGNQEYKANKRRGGSITITVIVVGWSSFRELREKEGRRRDNEVGIAGRHLVTSRVALFEPLTPDVKER